jgi:hypothetical protein
MKKQLKKNETQEPSQNVWHAPKTVQIKTFVAMNDTVIEEEKFHINHLSLHLKN